MKLDLSCPIELRGYALTCKDGTAEADVRLYNLSDRRIASFEAVAKWRSELLEKSLACPLVLDGLRAAKRSFFTLSLFTDRLPEASSLEILFTRVSFEDGTVWRADEGPFAEISPLPFLTAAELAHLRDSVGEDAVCYPRENRDTWQCVCGRLNAHGSECCARCRREHDAVFVVSPAEAVVETEPVDLPPRESLKALERQTIRNQSKKLRRALALSLTALAIAALLVLAPPRTSVQAAAQPAEISQTHR